MKMVGVCIFLKLLFLIYSILIFLIISFSTPKDSKEAFLREVDCNAAQLKQSQSRILWDELTV